MQNLDHNVYPKCRHHADCFANKHGHCDCLTSTFFHGKDCPFYKPKESNKEETIDYSA